MPDDHSKLRPYTISGGDVLHVTAVILVIGFFLAVGISSLAVGFADFFVAMVDDSGPVLNLVASLIAIVLIVFAVHYVLVRRRLMRWPEIGVTVIVPKVLAVGFLGGVAIALALSLVEQLVGPVEIDMAEDLFGGDGRPSILTLCATLLMVGIASPVAEELYFRGVVYTWMRSRWSSAVSVALNAALFGLVHGFYPPAYIAMVVFLGAVLALAYDRTRNIWLSVALHAGHNSAVVMMIYWSLA